MLCYKSYPNKIALSVLLATLILPVSGFAQEASEGVSETAYILNTFSFLIHGALVMFMAAGFTMLEAGSVRAKNVSAIIMKNVALYALAGFMFYIVGYNLMYLNVDANNGYLGTFSIWENNPSADDAYAPASDWFFQMVFVATAASIVSGTVAERMKLWVFLGFVAILAGFIYPIVGAWHWGGGWLAGMGFVDFAGSTIVHSVGGWAALAGALLLGARRNRFNADGTVNPMPASSVPLIGLGTFILWLGWFGFNGGSQLAMGSKSDVDAIANIYINTNSAAAGGVLIALLLSQLVYKRIRPLSILNAALGGLVAITAGPDTPSLDQAFLIGAVGGAIVVLTSDLLLKFKIDDVVGAIPVHLFCGIWGTLAVPFTNESASFMTQLTGVAAVGVFTFGLSGAFWVILRMTVGLRSSTEAENLGMDQVNFGETAYPEFQTKTYS